MLSVENHAWFNKQNKQEQAKMNNAFQEYKRSFKLVAAELTTEGIKQAQKIEIQEEYIEIPVEPMTEEELRIYEEHKRKRNERVFKKFEEYER